MPLAAGLSPRTYYNEQIIATPANTNSKSSSFNLGLVMLQQIVVLWPLGQNALIGVAFTLDGVALVPWNQPGSFVFDSGNRRTFDVGMLLDHPIVCLTHNGTSAAHSTFVTFVYTDAVLASDATPAAGLPVLSTT